MKLSHSKIETFNQCPCKFMYRYLDGYKTLSNQDSDNALYLGTALHTGIEKGIEESITEYHNNFYISDEKSFIEEYKLREMIKKIHLPDGEYEVEINHPDFTGFIDLLVDNGDGTYDIYDFKYSNNIDKYMQSPQLHLYKYFYEKSTGNKIKNLYFLFVPKTGIYKKKTETEMQFYKRLKEKLNTMQPELRCVEYNAEMVVQFLLDAKQLTESYSYEPHRTKLCDWCEYKELCMNGEDFMILPSIEEVPVTMDQYKKIWIYGEPFSGKTHLVSEAPAPVLELNTDGNVKHYTMPRLVIKDTVTMNGREEQKKFGWETFVEAVNELENGSEFKTIAVDILDDVFDSCRAFICDKNDWDHESDDSFKAYDIRNAEFLRVMKRLMNLPYNVILISHEDTSKDIMKRGGDKVTQIKPNINDKVAKKLAGMVDVVLRTEKNGDEYTISTKSNNVIFGGGRMHDLKSVELPNSWESVEKIYGSKVSTHETNDDNLEPQVAETETADNYTEKVSQEETKPARRTRRTRA